MLLGLGSGELAATVNLLSSFLFPIERGQLPL